MRRILSVTGSRADYGLMQPVHQAIASSPDFELHLVVTGMHLLPEFASSLAQVQSDAFGKLHYVTMTLGEDTARAMAQSLSLALFGIANVLENLKPDILLVQGDRGEELAAAIAAGHMNIPIVHMSGGDLSGSIDNSIRNAISKFAHFHLTNCAASSRQLVEMGENPDRIMLVGEPGLDLLHKMEFIPLETLAAELSFPPDRPYLVATLHPVTDEAQEAAQQMTILLEALSELDTIVIFTYPNSDAGGRAMRDVLESWREHAFLRIVPNLGSQRYLSLVRHAKVVVGNSSSGLFDTPTLKVPSVNIGSRQQHRVRAENVVDVDFDRRKIIDAINFVQTDPDFKKLVRECRNPFGDGRAAERTVDVLHRLRLGTDIVSKWKPSKGSFICPPENAI